MQIVIHSPAGQRRTKAATYPANIPCEPVSSSGPNATVDICVINFRVAPSETDFEFTWGQTSPYRYQPGSARCRSISRILRYRYRHPAVTRSQARFVPFHLSAVILLRAIARRTRAAYPPGDYVMRWRLRIEGTNSSIVDVCQVYILR